MEISLQVSEVIFVGKGILVLVLFGWSLAYVLVMDTRVKSLSRIGNIREKFETFYSEIDDIVKEVLDLYSWFLLLLKQLFWFFLMFAIISQVLMVVVGIEFFVASLKYNIDEFHGFSICSRVHSHLRMSILWMELCTVFHDLF